MKNLKFIGIKTYKGLDSIYKNFIVSLERLNLDKSFELIRIDLPPAYYGTKGFKKITLEKLRIIKGYLKSGFDVFYTDIDVIFLKNPLSYLKKTANEYDLLVQDESFFYKDSLGFKVSTQNNINPGILYIKSNKKTIKLFSSPWPKDYFNMMKNSFLGKNFYFDDQKLLNSRLSEKSRFDIKYKTLPINYFVAGKSLYNHSINLSDAYAVHFNSISVLNKIDKMREHNLWFLS